MRKAVIWDLDGTLLDTLDDLTASVNAALAAHGLPQHSREAVRGFVGNGVPKLIARAVPPGTPDALRETVLASFLAHYGEHSRDATRPYPGVLALLDALLARGVTLAIVSNKVDFAVRALADAYFGARIAVAVGDAPQRRPKPAPDGVLEALRQLGVTAAEAVYVGDSDVDVLTARSAGLPCVAVSWGFRSAQSLAQAGAERIAATPQALYQYLEEL